MGSRPSVGKYKRFTEKQRPDRYGGGVQNALLGIPAERIARVCFVDIATARRWKAGKSRIPPLAVLALNGDMAIFGFKEWELWRVDHGNIFSPDQWKIDRNHALSVPLMEAQLRQKDAEIAALKDALEYLRSVQALEDQPSAGAIPKISSER